jgi:hypothetical protein
LQENIAQAKSNRDTNALRVDRKRILADLNNVTRQVTEDNFIQVCIANCRLFEYLAPVYETAYYALDVFGDERVWTDQCQRVVDDFRKRPAVAEAAKEAIESTRVALYRIDVRVFELIRLIEEYERICRLPSRRIGNKRDEVIRQLNMFVEEMQTIDNESLKELIEWYQEAILSADPSQAHSGSTDEDIALTEIPAEPEQQDQELAQQLPFRHGEEPSQQLTHQRKEESFQKSTHQREEEASSSEEEIDQTALREAMVRVFNMEDLRSLCSDITQALHLDGIDDPVYLDLVEGTGLRGKVQGIVEHLARRDYLSYLIVAVCQARPRLKFCKGRAFSRKENQKKAT